MSLEYTVISLSPSLYKREIKQTIKMEKVKLGGEVDYMPYRLQSTTHAKYGSSRCYSAVCHYDIRESQNVPLLAQCIILCKIYIFKFAHFP